MNITTSSTRAEFFQPFSIKSAHIARFRLRRIIIILHYFQQCAVNVQQCAYNEILGYFVRFINYNYFFCHNSFVLSV